MGVRIRTNGHQNALCNPVLRAQTLDGRNPSAIGVQSPELNSTKRPVDERTSPSGTSQLLNTRRIAGRILRESRRRRGIPAPTSSSLQVPSPPVPVRGGVGWVSQRLLIVWRRGSRHEQPLRFFFAGLSSSRRRGFTPIEPTWTIVEFRRFPGHMYEPLFRNDPKSRSAGHGQDVFGAHGCALGSPWAVRSHRRNRAAALVAHSSPTRWRVAPLVVIAMFAIVSEFTAVNHPAMRVYISGSFLGIVLAAVALGGGPGRAWLAF